MEFSTEICCILLFGLSVKAALTPKHVGFNSIFIQLIDVQRTYTCRILVIIFLSWDYFLPCIFITHVFIKNLVKQRFLNSPILPPAPVPVFTFAVHQWWACHNEKKSWALGWKAKSSRSWTLTADGLVDAVLSPKTSEMKASTNMLSTLEREGTQWKSTLPGSLFHLFVKSKQKYTG